MPATALGMGGMYILGCEGGRIGFFPGDLFSTAWTTDQYDPGEWNHIAVVMTTSDPTARAYSDVTAYLNGQPIHSAAKTFPWFLTRAVSVGNHQYADWSDYEGLVYEPRVSLGALTPDQFTVVAPSGGLSAPDSVTAASNGGPAVLSVPLGNTAATDFHVTGISYSGTHAAAFSDTTITPLVILPGGGAEILVAFAPSGSGLAEATLTLTTDDPAHATLAVGLSVDVHDPGIVIDPVITEFLASNGSGLADGDGDRDDWIEIFNPGNAAVSLFYQIQKP